MKKIIELVRKIYSFFLGGRSLGQFIRYLVTGFSSFFVEYLVFFTLFRIVDLNEFIANTSSIVVVFWYNFLMNRYWSFKSKEPLKKQILQYGVLFFFNISISNLFMLLSKHYLGISPLIAKVLVMVFIVMWNFALYKTVIFKHKGNQQMSLLCVSVIILSMLNMQCVSATSNEEDDKASTMSQKEVDSENNLILNGSFTEGLTMWSFQKVDGVLVTLTQGSDQDGEGILLHLSEESDFMVTQQVQLEKATMYHVHCKVKAKVQNTIGAGNITLYYGSTGIDSLGIYTSPEFIDTQGTWEELKFSFVSHPTLEEPIVLGLRLGGQGIKNVGEVYFDEITLTKKELTDVLPTHMVFVDLKQQEIDQHSQYSDMTKQDQTDDIAMTELVEEKNMKQSRGPHGYDSYYNYIWPFMALSIFYLGFRGYEKVSLDGEKK